MKTLAEIKNYLADTRVKVWHDDTRLVLYAPNSLGEFREAGECGCTPDGAIKAHNFAGLVVSTAERARWLQSRPTPVRR